MKERFEKFFTKSEGCWLWSGALSRSGYGWFRLSKKNGQISAHRFSYQIYNGEIPNGKIILHSCDNKACVNPSHLSIGTYKDNMQDMLRKGRNDPSRGSKNGHSKLKEKDIEEIRRQYKQGKTQISIGRFFGVGQDSVSLIVNKKTWAHVK